MIDLEKSLGTSHRIFPGAEGGPEEFMETTWFLRGIEEELVVANREKRGGTIEKMAAIDGDHEKTTEPNGMIR